jgi:hypothetical protein
MNGIRERKRSKLSVPAAVMSGDSIRATFRDHNGVERVLAQDRITRAMHIVEVVIFDADEGVFGDGESIGAAFVEEKK